MNTSTVDNTVSAAEAYALWGERIRLLFSSPPSFLESSLDQSPFERRSCCVPTRFSDIASATTSPVRSEATVRGSSSSMADTEVVGDAGACASYLDEALFPYCFYARLLQTQGAASSVPPATLSASLHTSALLQAQKLRVDEDDVAIRLAGRLRERTARAHGSLQGLCSVPPGNLVAPFCDPTVEEQQAQLHSELTAFLLEVRRKNLASVQLRHQLQHSRAVQARLHDNGRLF
ncbi:hypothetical_protein [Leishmania braziliensis MHOM/BR/75/M2904]|uniref:Hypothetical_protein n=1 Tax=Leishmania braziliensis MHOM/BR/75/M2904 TaxID=420245 RepID=A0A3P3ZI04_LEIBR|nr:hypothetical_protein [Leishmania braziliensis MHOM/BR/75/M2904]